MEKKLLRIILFFGVFIFFTGCSVTISENDLLTKPDVEAKGALISISIPRQSTTTKYVNIYRKDMKNEEQITNIGLLYPSAMESVGSSYIFIDSLVVANHTYSYMARYCDDDEYFSTEWSNKITATDGYNESQSLKYKENSTTFTVNEIDYTLKISGTILPADIIDFDTDYKPMLIISTEDTTQVFSIQSIDDETLISLRGFLPASFLNKDVTIVGIVAQKTEFVPQEDLNATPITRKIYWSEPTEIKLNGYEGKTLYIPAPNSADGVDYSKKVMSNQY